MKERYSISSGFMYHELAFEASKLRRRLNLTLNKESDRDVAAPLVCGSGGRRTGPPRAMQR